MPILTYIHTCIHTYIHTYMLHTHTHTHTHLCHHVSEQPAFTMSSSSSFGSGGQSTSTIRGKNSAMTVFLECIHSSDTRESAYGRYNSIENMPTAVLTSQDLWEHCANFLASEHVVLVGEHKGHKLGVRTARGYLRKVMHCAKDECSKRLDPSNTVRFVCVVLKCVQLTLIQPSYTSSLRPHSLVA